MKIIGQVTAWCCRFGCLGRRCTSHRRYFIGRYALGLLSQLIQIPGRVGRCCRSCSLKFIWMRDIGQVRCFAQKTYGCLLTFLEILKVCTFSFNQNLIHDSRVKLALQIFGSIVSNLVITHSDSEWRYSSVGYPDLQPD